MQPAAKMTCPHRRYGAVINGIQRVLFATAEGAVNFQVAAGRGVENHGVGLRLLSDPSDVG